MAKFCRYCGKKLPDGAMFCPACGNKLGEPGAAQSPKQAPAPAPAKQTSAPAPAKRPASQKKRGPGLIPVLLLLAVLVTAGIRFSGILTDPGKPGGGSGKKTDHAKLSQVDTEKYWMPPDPEDILLDYSEEEIAEAPETVMQVSPENTSAESGTYAVDFGSWNLAAEDRFSIRKLPVHIHEEEGYVVQGYDLSLASGRTKFYSEVKVTLPRSEGDGDGVMFLTKDPETGENECEYFEISEDGSSYVLYTTHFSGHNKVTISDFGKNISEVIRRGDITGQETRDALSAFYYPVRVPWNERMTAPVNFSPYDLWTKTMDKYTYLPSGYSLMGAAAEKIRSNPQKTVPKEVNLGGVLIFDTNTLNNMSADANTVVDQTNNLRSVTIEQGVEALNKLSLEKVSPGFQKMIEKSTKSNFFTRVSAATTIIGFQLTNQKAIRELEAGKYSTYSESLWGNWRDYAGTLIGAAGLTGAAIVSTPVTVTAAVGGMMLYFISKSYETPYDDLMGAERNYREYYSAGGFSRRFFYDAPELANTAYGINGAVGNIRPLTKLNAEQNQKLKYAINEGLKQPFGMGGLMGEDTRSKLINPEWSAVVVFIMEILKDEPQMIGPAVQEFYKNYTYACWDMGDESFLEFSRQAMRERNEDPSAARLPSEENSSKEAFAEILQKELFIKHQPMFLDIARFYEHQEQMAVNKMIRKELVPLLNTPMEFTVKDKSLKDPSKFSKSVFSKELKDTGKSEVYVTENGRYNDFSKNSLSPMYFCMDDQNGGYQHVHRPVFMPSVNFSKDYREYEHYTYGLSLLKGFYEDYYPAKTNFLPALKDKKGNVVFRCTYFHYLMMGAPTAMAFRDVDEKDGAEIVVPFEIPGQPGSDGKFHVEIEVDPGGPAVWQLEKLVYQSHYHYEAPQTDYSGLPMEERAKKIKEHLFDVTYSDIIIQADPNRYTYDSDVRGGVTPSAPAHIKGDLPGAGGTRKELIKRLQEVGKQAYVKVLPSEGEPFQKWENIPEPKAGGNRRLCIKYNYVVLVYRETKGTTVSKDAWEHVNENSGQYWDRVVLGKKKE